MKPSKDPSQLLNELVAYLAPVKRPPSAGAALTLWTMGSFAVAAALVSGFHYRSDLLENLATCPGFLLAGLIAAGIGTLGLLAYRSGTPGRESPPWMSRVVPVILGVFVVLLIGIAAREPAGTAMETGLDPRGIRCSAVVTLLALIPAIALLLSLKHRYATVRPKYAGRMLGGAAGLVGTLFISFHCPVDEGIHLLVWHLGPVFLISWVFSKVATRYLRF